jgi:hypothetical protein
MYLLLRPRSRASLGNSVITLDDLVRLSLLQVSYQICSRITLFAAPSRLLDLKILCLHNIYHRLRCR